MVVAINAGTVKLIEKESSALAEHKEYKIKLCVSHIISDKISSALDEYKKLNDSTLMDKIINLVYEEKSENGCFKILNIISE